MRALNIIIYLLYLHSSSAELKLLQTLFRHGNRLPVDGAIIYPNDPYANLTYEPHGYGSLTNKGKMLAYELGQYLRARYDDFLGPLYTESTVEFYSSDVNRVVMTTELVAAGLYPPVGEQSWNPNLNWQPIPVWMLKLFDNNMYTGTFCKNFKKLFSRVKETDPDVQRYIEENSDVYDYLSYHTGRNITQDEVFNLWQLLFSQYDIGLELPEWTKKVFPNGKLDEMASTAFLFWTSSTELKQLSGGAWIKEFLQNIDNYINKGDTKKAIMYGGHELNIAFILAVLNNFDNQIPYYCSSIIIELHENNDQYYVQLLYKDKDEIRTLDLPECGGKMCPLDDFRKFVEPIIPHDLAALCGN